jgi:hypothetical protein
MICLPVGPSAFDGLQIFDNAAGGAGHVVELMVDSKSWLLRAMQVMRRDDEHHETCEKGCLRCILTTSSQRDWETGNLVRRKAYKVLDSLLNGNPDTDCSGMQVKESQAVKPRSLESRLARLRGGSTIESNKTKMNAFTSEWQQVANDIAPEFLPLLSALNRLGIDLPVCGYDLVDESKIVVNTAELCWPGKRVAVLSDSESANSVKIPGWAILKYPGVTSLTDLANKLQNLIQRTM